MRIGEGAFAFLVSPPIPSTKLPISSRDILSKIFKQKQDVSQPYQPHYRPFKEIVTGLKPVVSKLQRLDPVQERFLYPIFMENEGVGELSDELKKDGVTDQTKLESYYVFRGGPSYEALFGEFIEVFRNIALGYDPENTSEEERAQWLYNYNTLYSFVYPLSKKVEALTRELHANHIHHRDLHGGNVLLNSLSPPLQLWIQKAHAFLRNVKESPDYRILKSILGKDCLLTFDVTSEQRRQFQELIDDLKGVDMKDVKPVLIDWDSARILEEEEYNTDDIFYHLFPLDCMVSRFWKDMDAAESV